MRAARDSHRRDVTLLVVRTVVTRRIGIPGRGLTFDMSGMTRLAGACPLDGGVRLMADEAHVLVLLEALDG